ncbi:MAG TPA: hypothetical protein VIT44_06960 [Cyclobacteriaceae bacterium]
MNSQGINSNPNQTGRVDKATLSSASKKKESKEENENLVTKYKTGRKRVFFNLLIGYK